MATKVFVPGGAGYIGSTLCRTLLERGFHVHVLDQLFFGQTHLLSLARHKHFKFTLGDLRDDALIKDAVKDADVIIPLAALVGAPICAKHPKLAEEINLAAPLQLFNRVSANQMLLMPTTNSAYGGGESSLYCDESSPLNPISLYARHKVELESHLMKYGNAISFRLATVFGVSPRMRLDLLVNDFTYRARRDGRLEIFEGHFKRNYIHVADVAAAFLHGIENFDRMKGQIYNVGLSSANLSKLELCQVISKYTPVTIVENASAKDPDQRNYIVSNEKIEATGYRPSFSLDDGIQEVLRAFPLLREDMDNLHMMSEFH